jgi:selenocysteine lyase/cysteine desulfurase
MSTDPQPAARTDPWAALRAQMPVARNWAYFDHASVAPIPEATARLVAAWADDVATSGDVHWLDWAGRLERLRRAAARLLAADPAEIALVRNTTEGMNLVAEGFPWRAGDNLVVPADEFPSNLYPWMQLARLGVETRRVAPCDGRIELADLEAACDRHTRLIAASWVGYASGWRLDLDALCELAHRRGAYLFVDAIQGLGVFPINVERTPIDFLAADGHKWLLGPEGAGIFYLRREHLDLLRPIGVGWNSVVQGANFSHIELTYKPAASRYEGGTPNMGGLAGLGESLELLLSYGAEALAGRIVELTDLACDRLRSIGATIASRREGEHRSGIVSFTLPGVDLAQVRRQCLAEKVVLGCRGGRIRISPHAYNDASDIERLVAALGRKILAS